MNKKQVAEFLNKSERTVAVYVEKGRLTRKFENKNGIQHAVFNPDEVEKLKAELAAEARPATIVKGEAAPTSRGEAPIDQNVLARVQPTLAAGVDGMSVFASMLSDTLGEAFKEGIREAYENIALKPSELAAKMVLTIPEAMVLSGFKEKPIRDAIKSGDLPSVHIGRSKQVRPSDLKKWVDSKFEK